MGTPGAGKGTQAKLLASRFGACHISTGDVLREAVRGGSKLGLEAKRYMEQGLLVPDEVVIGIVAERLDGADCKGGFLLDGFPRTVAQAKALDALLARRGQPLGGVLLIALPREDALKRLAEVRADARAGTAPAGVDALAEERTLTRGARPAFKGYTVAGRVCPASICISINDEVVHGVPSRKRTLREGDIVGLDFGVSYRGYYGDAALTVPVGRVTPEAERLMEVTRAALAAGIAASQAGGHVGDISGAIQDTAEAAGYSLVREFVGHGIGRSLHEDPQVPNYRTGARGVRLQERSEERRVGKECR